MNNHNYQDALDTLTDGDIVFFHGHKSVVDSVIEDFTESPLVHVAIAFTARIGLGIYKFVIEAQGGTDRRIVPFSFYEGATVNIIRPLISDTLFVSAFDKALSGVGKVAYDYAEAGYAGLEDFLEAKMHFKLPKDHPATEICSTFVAETYRITDQAVSPADLYKLLLTMDLYKEV